MADIHLPNRSIQNPTLFNGVLSRQLRKHNKISFFVHLSKFNFSHFLLILPYIKEICDGSLLVFLNNFTFYFTRCNS